MGMQDLLCQFQYDCLAKIWDDYFLNFFKGKNQKSSYQQFLLIRINIARYHKLVFIFFTMLHISLLFSRLILVNHNLSIHSEQIHHKNIIISRQIILRVSVPFRQVYNLSMRTIKQPIFSQTQRITSQEEMAFTPFRQSYFEATISPSLRQMRSLSKNKKKLRYHLFKNKNLITENQFYSPNRQEYSKGYSSYVQLLPNVPLQPKSSLKTAVEEKPQVKKPQKKQPQPDNNQPDRKEKREFKLIHQIKKEKANKVKQKVGESEIYQKAVLGHIEAVGAKKMQIFAQQIHQMLKNPTQIKSAKVSEVIAPIKSKVNPQMDVSFEPDLEIQQPSEFIPTDPVKQQQQHVLSPRIQQSYRQPDLNRSCLKAQQILRQRRDSNSSMDISTRLSKIREQMNLSLALQSINNSKANMSEFFRDILQSNKGHKASTGDRLKVHIRILQTLSHFVFESTRFDIVTEEWEELNFLIYKKYYIERVKVLNFINKYPMRNPFNIYNAEISSKEVIDFMKTEEGGKFKAEVRRQTADVRTRLGTFYGHFDKAKVGEKINLFQYDNFSHWIIEELWAELILTEYNASHQREVIEHRMCRILQLIFLISELNGKYQFPFEEAENAIRSKEYKSYIRQGKDIFEKYILYKST